MNQPLFVNITPHREFLPADTADQRLFIMLKLRPTQEVAQSRPSTTFAFIIDTSGSMYEQVEGGKTKIDIVIDSLYGLVRSGRLTQSDRIAIIQFDNHASTLIGLTPATDVSKLESAISRLRDFSGGTCMGRGMSQALSLLANQNMTSRRALIFTDGETFDEPECEELALDFANNGIPITALGVGDYNEDLLTHLSDTTGGQCFNVVENSINLMGNDVAIANLPQTLFEQAQQAQQEVINNLKLNLSTVKGVELVRVTRVYPDQADFPLNQKPYPIGVAMANDETIFILEFKIDSRAGSKVRIAQLGLTYDIPGQQRTGELPPQNVVVQFIPGGGNAAQVDQEVMGYVQQRNISQLVVDATRVAESNPQQAEQLLETAKRLTVKIGNQAMLESLNGAQSELRKTQKISAGTRKTVKMGSKGKTVKMGSDDINEQLSDEEIRKLSGT
jgi:Ca-activated chloride channel family protein